MRAFVEMMIAKVKSLPVGSMARQHVEDAIEFYNGLLAPKQAATAKQAAEQDTPTPPTETPQAKAEPVPPSQENYSDSFGNTIDFLPDGQARWIARDGTVLKEGPEQEVIDFAYRLDIVIGRTYGAAQRKYPALKDPKAAAELDDIADELEKVLADVPWRERTDFMTRQFEAWAQERLGQQEEQAAAASEGVAAVKAAAKAAAAAKDGSEPEPVVVDGTKGDGKPNKATPYRPDQGEDWFIHAKIQMDKIHPNDISREKALRKMVAYCEERLKSKK
jgi:hypothetical protein